MVVLVGLCVNLNFSCMFDAGCGLDCCRYLCWLPRVNLMFDVVVVSVTF